MKKILWISRHQPLPEQVRFLREKLGEIEIVIHSEPLATAEHAVKLAEDVKADYIVPVLPLSFVARLVEGAVKKGFTVLRAEMELIHICTSQPCPLYSPERDTIVTSTELGSGRRIYRHYRFKGFSKIKAVEIIAEPL